MKKLFLIRKQAPELKMSQMAEEITGGRHTLMQAMAN
jgi:hypothetical protein